LSEVRRAVAREVTAGRGQVLDAALGARLAGAREPATAARPAPPAIAPAPAIPAASPRVAIAPAAAPAAFAHAAPASASAAPDREARLAKLADLAARVADCTRCVLAETRTKVVVGVGTIDPPIMLVGEAPGHDEDQSGEPFVGRAGQLLTRILGAMQLERAQVYIANVIKCRPPENRNPLPGEITACSPFLAEQIQLVRPRILVALGRYAASTLLRTQQSLASLRGRAHDYQGIPLVVTYHPSALLRYPQYKKPTWEDMQFVLKLLEEPTAGEMAEPLAAGRVEG
ncbi:MAG TPA: uracil-DNA glycosylase, partial [Candidatus Udaeobacter sp.]|nr:uracil-DNA glycosylase [Candidatus Udaeobacter sp.]